MSPPVDTQFSLKEVEDALVHIVREAAGFDNASFTLAETVDRCFKRCDSRYSIWARLGHGTWEELDFADILHLVDRHFDLDMGLKRWDQALSLRARLQWPENQIPTWREIADVVVANAVRYPAIPRRILGTDCLAAGVFDSLCQIAQRTARCDTMRISPQDSIRGLMKSRMIRFRRRIEINFGCTLPPEPRSRGVTCFALTWGTIASVIGWVASAFAGAAILFLGTAIAIIACIVSALLVHRFWPPFPTELRTFKALSRWLANEMRPHPTPQSAGLLQGF